MKFEKWALLFKIGVPGEEISYLISTLITDSEYISTIKSMGPFRQNTL